MLNRNMEKILDFYDRSVEKELKAFGKEILIYWAIIVVSVLILSIGFSIHFALGNIEIIIIIITPVIIILMTLSAWCINKKSKSKLKIKLGIEYKSIEWVNNANLRNVNRQILYLWLKDKKYIPSTGRAKKEYYFRA